MRQPRFSFELTVPGEPAQVWARVWDLDRHTAAVPLTRVVGCGPGGLSSGERFVARTGLGPLGFDDEMVVREWDPPHRAVIDKVGRVLTGSIEVTIEPAVCASSAAAGAPSTRLRWSQRYGVTGVPGAVAGLAAPAVRAAYRRAVGRITRP